MLSEYNVLSSPADHIKDLIASAFTLQAKNRRSTMRVIQRVLALAEARGYLYAADFMHYLRTTSHYNPKAVNRLLSGLFEYVSPDECSQLAKYY
jgi:hypothetical protein